MLMGRKTFESIGKPLHDRTNLVASRKTSIRADGVRVVSSVRYELMSAIIRDLCDEPVGDVFVIGGAEVYRAALPFCSRAYVTRVHTRVEGDNLVRFPCDLSSWRVLEREEQRADACHAHAFEFLTMVRP